MEKIGEKRPAADDRRGVLCNVKALLMEADGTASTLASVKEKLCEYVKENTHEYLTANFDDKEVQELVEELRKQAASDAATGAEAVFAIPAADANRADIVKAVVDSINGQLSKGRMTEPLRKIVGNIWREGYKKKAIGGELFDDVIPALKVLAEQGTRAYVFSSRCLDSQRQLFASSKDGDQSKLISGYFDASAGPRTEKDTYMKIAKDLEMAPSDVMYLTHQSTEATAAHAAGMKTALVVRPGNPQLSDKDRETFQTISSFSELFGEGLAEVPEKKICPEQTTPKTVSQTEGPTEVTEKKTCPEQTTPKKTGPEQTTPKTVCQTEGLAGVPQKKTCPEQTTPKTVCQTGPTEVPQKKACPQQPSPQKAGQAAKGPVTVAQSCGVAFQQQNLEKFAVKK